MQSGMKVVIDLDFQEKMVEQDMRHLCQQLAYSYASNTRAEKPCHLHLTSYNGKLKDMVQAKVSGALPCT